MVWAQFTSSKHSDYVDFFNGGNAQGGHATKVTGSSQTRTIKDCAEYRMFLFGCCFGVVTYQQTIAMDYSI